MRQGICHISLRQICLFSNCCCCCYYYFFFIIKPTRCTNFTNLFQNETLHVSDSSSVHHQEFIHSTLSNDICHTGLQTAVEQDHMLLLDSCLQTCMTYIIAKCRVNKLLMMDRGTVRNMQSFMLKQICEISASSWFYYKEICYAARSHERKSCCCCCGERATSTITQRSHYFHLFRAQFQVACLKKALIRYQYQTDHVITAIKNAALSGQADQNLELSSHSYIIQTLMAQIYDIHFLPQTPDVIVVQEEGRRFP